jgi:hypothetical protein
MIIGGAGTGVPPFELCEEPFELCEEPCDEP